MIFGLGVFEHKRLIEEMLIHWLKERGFDFSYILFFTEFNNYYSCYKHRQFRENILGCKAIEEKNIIHLLSIIRIQFHRNRSMSFLNPLPSVSDKVLLALQDLNLIRSCDSPRSFFKLNSSIDLSS